MHKSLSDLFRHHINPIAKLFMATIIIVGTAYAIFNAVHLKQLSKSVITDFNQIYSVSRRFAQYYNNTDVTFAPKGIYERDGVGIMVSKSGEVKELSNGINKLRSELDPITHNNVWTIAIFEHPANYGHFSPLREEYKKRYGAYEADDVMKRIVKLERLENTFDQFYGCNIKLSEPYQEDGSKQWVRTIYYPVYNKRTLDALLAIDLKNDYIDLVIALFNNEHFTVINTNTTLTSYQQTIEIPCTDAEPIIVGFSVLDIVKRTFIASLLISFLAHLIVVYFKGRQRRITRDKMTGFYRRDFYEPRLNRAHNFSMLIIDIDFFKIINDTHGHKKGDEVISEVTRRIASQIRSTDAAVRWGGEEFVVLFKDMTDDMLYDKAELIREHVANSAISGIDVTISVGGVTLRDSEFSEAYKLADHALYQSKRDGRNRVTIYDENATIL
ncbi:GGDEF domain-containing protein [Vibrio scophthalmi]|uniref:GGDEF domain-containing protein n=1 Tax=Vibrio scophthalmi TaxID=45658 RepID=UPI002284F57B|nr:GGDEF domain-containing protein [Vibrio scophthalmi]MCY9803496.1 GGDEF domain-containing protein [Vibrio scophthalmi]